jgi:formyl-CoA transferase/CoA:oxalate CoA-transferase
VTLLNYHAEGFLLTGAVPKALGSSHPSLSPYRTFRCRDGQWVFIAGANDRFWQRLVLALDLGALRNDERFAKNLGRVRHRVELEAAVADAIAKYDREPLLKLLEDAGVPATPVNTVDQVMNDPQTAARQMIERVLHPKLGEIPVIGTPVKYSRMRPGVRTPAPLQGEHTDEVLAEWGYCTDEIAALRAKKVIL